MKNFSTKGEGTFDNDGLAEQISSVFKFKVKVFEFIHWTKFSISVYKLQHLIRFFSFVLELWLYPLLLSYPVPFLT